MTEGHPHQWERTGNVRVHCSECIAECCKHISIPIDKPEDEEDWQAMADYLHHENVCVYKDVENDWLVDVKTRCKNIDGRKCKIWGTKDYPKTCSEYDMDTCVMNEPGDYWMIMFENPEDIAEHVKKKGFSINTRKPRNCREECCNHINIPLDAPEEWRDLDDMKWYLWHENVIVMMDDDGDWFAEVKVPRRNRCTKCDLQRCRDDDYEYPVVFFEPADADKYAEKNNITIPEKTTKEMLKLT